MKFVHVAFCISLLFSINCYSADLSSKCFDRFVNFDLPFEIYGEDSWYIKAIQPLKEGYESSTDGVLFIEKADQVSVAPLCNGNFVAVWTFSHAKFPVPLTGRIFNSQFKTVCADFFISGKSETEDWEHSVSALYDDGFVVTWKTWKTRARKEIKLRARIFDNAGKPRGEPFDIYSVGVNNGCLVYGLPKGGFVVVWHNFDNFGEHIGKALLRVFDKKGIPKTEGVPIALDNKECTLKPKGYISKAGNINIFMTCQTHHSARSFNEEGKALTGVLVGEHIKSIDW
jgi:hypothetical protein